MMWFVDGEYLDGIARGDGDYLTTIVVDPDRPYFDIEVLSDVHSGEYSELEPKRARKEFVERFRRLRRPFNEGRPSHLLINCGDLIGQPPSGGPDARAAQDDYTAIYRNIWVPAFDELASLAPNFLTIPGDHDVGCEGGTSSGPGRSDASPRRSDPYYRQFAAHFSRNRVLPTKPEEFPVASVFRVCDRTDTRCARPLAYIAVVGFDSNDAEYRHEFIRNYGQICEEQLGASRKLIQLLARTTARNAPLYILGVTHHNLLPVEDRILKGSVTEGVRQLDAVKRRLECAADERPRWSTFCATNQMLAANALSTTANASGFLRHCHDHRMSLVIHGNMHQRDVVTVASTPMDPDKRPSDIAVVPCPSFAEGTWMSGMARIRINIWRGDAGIAFNYDPDIDAEESKPVQNVRPLVSASRVNNPERRLYAKVHELIDEATAGRTDNGRDDAAIDGFREYVDRSWSRTGYVPLCEGDGTLPDLPVTRHTRYHLLLLLRERAGGYDMLLSRHTPLRPAEVADWDALLLPAFTSVRSLLERLRDDVMRQVMDQAENLEKALHAMEFEEAIGRILDLDRTTEGDIWADQIREVAAAKRRKISPTNGLVTEYEYSLVTLLPLIRRPSSLSRSEGDPGEERSLAQRRLDYDTIMDWLNELPTIRRGGEERSQDGERSRGVRVIPMEALQSGGAGLRWDPEAELVDEPAAEDRWRATKIPPGAVWFPIAGKDDVLSPWLECPSIVARNADVMHWVDQELGRRRQDDGKFPPELLLGGLARGRSTIEFVGPQRPFMAVAADEDGVEIPARSTVEALAKVEFLRGFDLDGQRAYENLQPKRVFLMRREVDVWTGTRSVISVVDADQHDVVDAADPPESAILGFLRPVQRYVLRSGLERATEIDEQVLSKLDDPWGFIQVKKGDAPEPVSVTPPILEQLHPADWEDEKGAREFILCDGNHRVVQHVWIGGRRMPAVALLGRPAQPYYARPFSKFEWEYTADNVQDISPDQASKYAVRKVDLSTLDAPARELLSRIDPQLHYRRYFRDLSTGFGYMGGQGGRYV